MGGCIVLLLFEPSIWFHIHFLLFIFAFFCLVVIHHDPNDSVQTISVRLDEKKNYSCWGYVIKFFLRGKKMWGYIIGTLRKPMNENDEKYEEQLDICEVSNLKIIIGIDNSVDN